MLARRAQTFISKQRLEEFSLNLLQTFLNELLVEKRANESGLFSFSLRYFLKGAAPCRWLQLAWASTYTHTHTAVAARDIPAAAALSLPHTRPPGNLPGGRMPNESRACLPLPRSQCVRGGGMAGRLGASTRGKGRGGEWVDRGEKKWLWGGWNSALKRSLQR